MKKASKLLALVLSVMLVCGMLAACGGSSGGNGGGGGATTAAPTTEAGGGGGDKAATVELVFSHYEPTASTQAQNIEEWAADVAAASNGTINIEVMGGGALGAEVDCLELVKSGAADITMSTPSLFNNMLPYLQVMQTPMLGVPSATVGTNVIWDAYDQYKEAFDAMYADLGVKVLIMFTTPSSVIATKTPVHNVGDLKGMRLRASAGMLSDLCTAWGATPVSLGQSEIYEAMEKNAIDGHVNVWSAMAPFKFFEVGKYALSMDIFVNALFLVIGLDQWNALSPEQQAALESCSYREGSLKYLVSAMEANSAMSISVCEENGVEVYYPTEEEIAGFAEAAPSVSEAWFKENSSDRMDMFELYDFVKADLANY